MAKRNGFSWRIFLAVALASAVCSVTFYRIVAKPPVFFTAQSPSGIYTIHFSGQKERPFWFAVEVFVDVLKEGKSFSVNQRIHSGDAMDLSFEMGWPDHRWIGENVLQLYSRESFGKFSGAEELVLYNSANKVVHQLTVHSSNDKFFVFDLQPGAEISLTATPPRGDFSSFNVQGTFDDGTELKGSAVFDVEGDETPSKYFMYITDDGIKIGRALPTKITDRTED